MAFSPRHAEESDEENEEETIIHGELFSYKDLIGYITQPGVKLKKFMVISDVCSKRELYTVCTKWLNFKLGVISCPFATVKKDNNKLYDYMVQQCVPHHTNAIPFKSRNVKITWKVFGLKAVLAHFDTYQEADKWMEEEGKQALDSVSTVGSDCRAKNLITVNSQSLSKRQIKPSSVINSNSYDLSSMPQIGRHTTSIPPTSPNPTQISANPSTSSFPAFSDPPPTSSVLHTPSNNSQTIHNNTLTSDSFSQHFTDVNLEITPNNMWDKVRATEGEQIIREEIRRGFAGISQQLETNAALLRLVLSYLSGEENTEDICSPMMLPQRSPGRTPRMPGTPQTTPRNTPSKRKGTPKKLYGEASNFPFPMSSKESVLKFDQTLTSSSRKHFEVFIKFYKNLGVMKLLDAIFAATIVNHINLKEIKALQLFKILSGVVEKWDVVFPQVNLWDKRSKKKNNAWEHLNNTEKLSKITSRWFKSKKMAIGRKTEK